MKYIRTKDGIYEAKKNKVGAWITKLPYKIFDRDVIKQADTIEELCDEFVAFEDGFLRPRLEFKNIDKSVLDAFLHCAKIECPNVDLFGAIWTDKGLIYVAKMNEEGKLCLI